MWGLLTYMGPKMELSAPSHLGVPGALGPRMPEPGAPDTTRVNPNEGLGKPGADPHQLSQNAENSALAKERKNLSGAHHREAPLAGPQPSFEISILEIEQDLKKEIARMEAARGRERYGEAITPQTSIAQNISLPQPQGGLEPTQDHHAPASDTIKTPVGVVYDTDSGPV